MPGNTTSSCLHNMPGLIAKLGGDDKFVARLDEMFDTKEKIPN